MRLDEQVEAIIDAVVTAVDDAREVGGLLEDEGIKAVVRGDRARPMPELPAVWIVPQNARMDLTSYGDEAWALPLSIAGLIKGDDVLVASKKSQRVTALARSAALRVPRGEGVIDVISTSFDAGARSSERNRNLHWTEAVITVLFTVTE